MENANEKAKLKEAFDSATSAQEMYDSYTNMEASGLFHDDELNFDLYKLTNKFQQQGLDPHNLLAFYVNGKEAELKKAFYDAKSTDERIEAFAKMEPYFTEQDLAQYCFKLLQQLYKENGDPEKILLYGTRALKYIVDKYTASATQMSACIIANVSLKLGSACRRLSRFEESLTYLNWCDKIMSQLEASFPLHIVLEHLRDVHTELALVKEALGKGVEVVSHRRKVLEIQERMLEDGSSEIGLANNGVADAYLVLGKFQDAFPFALKALEIYSGKPVGADSVEIAILRKSLGGLYCALKEYEKALERKGLSLGGMKLVEKMEAANMLIMLGKFEEGTGSMRDVISQAIIQGADFARASASVALARAFCKQDRFGDAKKHMKIALKLVEKKQVDPLVLAASVEELSKMYKEMEELETHVGTESYDQEFEKVVVLVKELGISEQGTVDGAVRLLKEMEDRASDGYFTDKNSKLAFKMEGLD